MHISFRGCQILSPSKTGLIVSTHRLISITLLTVIAVDVILALSYRNVLAFGTQH